MSERPPTDGARPRPGTTGRPTTLRRLLSTLTAAALFLGLAGLLAPTASAQTPCADLQVTGFDVAPSQPIAGQVATVTVQVLNSGTCVAQGFVSQWKQTPNGPAGPSEPVVDLGAGQTATLDLNYTFPKAGNFESIIVIDTANSVHETNEANNLQILPITVQPATVDLSVSSVTLDPVRPVRGRVATATIVVANSGNTAAKAFTVSWRPAPGASPIARQVNGLGAGDTATLELQYTYPKVGTFSSSVTVDSKKTVKETNELNNTKVFEVVVEPPLADLTVLSVDLTPDNPVAGEVVTAVATIANIGNTDATAFRTQWKPSGSAPALSSELPGLGAGETTTVSFDYTFKRAGVFAGTVTVDSLKRVRELSETNNTLSVKVPISPNAIDLEITDLRLAGREGSPTQGEPTTVELEVTNNGNTTSGPFLVDWNPDATYVISPSNRTVTKQVDDLGPGQSTVVSFTFSYPKAGNFSTLGTVDPRKAVVESNEANNQRVLPLTVGPGDIDLVITNFTLNPPQPVRSNPTTATITVRNTGSFPAGPFSVQWKLKAADKSGPSASVNGLNPGESRTLTLSGTYFAKGNFTTTATVDPANKVVEPGGGENNNVVSKGITVVPPSAKLQVSLDSMQAYDDGDNINNGEWDPILFAVFDPNGSCKIGDKTVKSFACRTFSDGSVDDDDDDPNVSLPADRSITVTLTESTPLVMATAVLEDDSPLAPDFLGFATAISPNPDYLTFGTKGVDGQKGDCDNGKCFQARFKVAVLGKVPPAFAAAAKAGVSGPSITPAQQKALSALQAAVRAQQSIEAAKAKAAAKGAKS